MLATTKNKTRSKWGLGLTSLYWKSSKTLDISYNETKKHNKYPNGQAREIEVYSIGIEVLDEFFMLFLGNKKVELQKSPNLFFSSSYQKQAETTLFCHRAVFTIIVSAINTKTKLITLVKFIYKGHNPVNQSEIEVNGCSWQKACTNMAGRVSIGFGFTRH